MTTEGQDIIVEDFVTEVTAGEALTALDAVYISTSDGKAYKCDADDLTKIGFIGFVIVSAAINTTVQIRSYGILTGFAGLTAGAIYYLSGTAGAITATIPTNKRIVGHALNTTTVKIFQGFVRIVDVPFTASGTWTKYPGLAFIEAEGQGAGAGGEGVSGDEYGAGGGGGGYCKKTLYATALGATETVTIGAAGAGGSAAPTSGSNGGDTIFGAHFTAGGGTGGGSGSGGGSATGGDVNIVGQNGGTGQSTGGTAGGSAVGSGGDSMMGMGGMQGGGDGSQVSGTGFGGGGAGAISNNSTNQAAGSGTIGYLKVREYYVY